MATLQQAQLIRRASCPVVTPAEWKPPLPQQPGCSSPDQDPQSGRDTSSPHVGLKTCAPDAAIEEPPTEISLLGPVPDGFGPAYDYLRKVRELANEVGPDVWEDCFERHTVKSPTRISIASQPWRTYTFNQDDPPETLFGTISLLRREFSKACEQHPFVITVESISQIGIQALGMALDVNPCFFAMHLRMQEEVVIPPEPGPNSALEDCWVKLCTRFESYVVSRRLLQQSASNADFHVATSMHDYECWITRFERKGCLSGLQDVPQSRHFGGTGRFMVEDGSMQLCPRISCMQGSKSNCILLVDAPLPIDCNSHNPFHESNMIKYCLYYQLSHVLSYEKRLGALIGTNILTALELLVMLSSYMVVNTWENNVAYMEARLELSRHEAIANPSMKTFKPLTTLRINIADLEQAILKARRLYNLTYTRALLDILDESDAKDLKRPEAEYESLLHRVKTMSTVLNNEIQLVIGSVTVQDSAIMKRQAKRASLLTVLAVIYLPLTLVTGIFGMNVRQINDATPELWASGIVLVVVSGVTAAGFFGYWYWRKFYDAREAEKREKEEKRYKVA